MFTGAQGPLPPGQVTGSTDLPPGFSLESIPPLTIKAFLHESFVTVSVRPDSTIERLSDIIAEAFIKHFPNIPSFSCSALLDEALVPLQFADLAGHVLSNGSILRVVPIPLTSLDATSPGALGVARVSTAAMMAPCKDAPPTTAVVSSSSSSASSMTTTMAASASASTSAAATGLSIDKDVPPSGEESPTSETDDTTTSTASSTVTTSSMTTESSDQPPANFNPAARRGSQLLFQLGSNAAMSTNLKDYDLVENGPLPPAAAAAPATVLSAGSSLGSLLEEDSPSILAIELETHVEQGPPSTGAAPVAPSVVPAAGAAAATPSSAATPASPNHAVLANLFFDDQELYNALRNRAFLRSFAEFCEFQYCLEPVLFWMDTEAFQFLARAQDARDLQVGRLVKMAAWIQAHYIDPEGPLRLNIHSNALATISAPFTTSSPPRADGFHNAQARMFSVIRDVLLPQYIRSRFYRDLERRIRRDPTSYQQAYVENIGEHFASLLRAEDSWSVSWKKIPAPKPAPDARASAANSLPPVAPVYNESPEQILSIVLRRYWPEAPFPRLYFLERQRVLVQKRQQQIQLIRRLRKFFGDQPMLDSIVNISPMRYSAGPNAGGMLDAAGRSSSALLSPSSSGRVAATHFASSSALPLLGSGSSLSLDDGSQVTASSSSASIAMAGTGVGAAPAATAAAAASGTASGSGGEATSGAAGPNLNSTLRLAEGGKSVTNGSARSVSLSMGVRPTPSGGGSGSGAPGSGLNLGWGITSSLSVDSFDDLLNGIANTPIMGQRAGPGALRPASGFGPYDLQMSYSHSSHELNAHPSLAGGAGGAGGGAGSASGDRFIKMRRAEKLQDFFGDKLPSHALADQKIHRPENFAAVDLSREDQDSTDPLGTSHHQQSKAGASSTRYLGQFGLFAEEGGAAGGSGSGGGSGGRGQNVLGPRDILAPAPTSNILTSEERRILMKRSRKLNRVLGNPIGEEFLLETATAAALAAQQQPASTVTAAGAGSTDGHHPSHHRGPSPLGSLGRAASTESCPGSPPPLAMNVRRNTDPLGRTLTHESIAISASGMIPAGVDGSNPATYFGSTTSLSMHHSASAGTLRGGNSPGPDILGHAQVGLCDSPAGGSSSMGGTPVAMGLPPVTGTGQHTGSPTSLASGLAAPAGGQLLSSSSSQQLGYLAPPGTMTRAPSSIIVGSGVTTIGGLATLPSPEPLASDFLSSRRSTFFSTTQGLGSGIGGTAGGSASAGGAGIDDIDAGALLMATVSSDEEDDDPYQRKEYRLRKLSKLQEFLGERLNRQLLESQQIIPRPHMSPEERRAQQKRLRKLASVFGHHPPAPGEGPTDDFPADQMAFLQDSSSSGDLSSSLLIHPSDPLEVRNSKSIRALAFLVDNQDDSELDDFFKRIADLELEDSSSAAAAVATADVSSPVDPARARQARQKKLKKLQRFFGETFSEEVMNKYNLFENITQTIARTMETASGADAQAILEDMEDLKVRVIRRLSIASSQHNSSNETTSLAGSYKSSALSAAALTDTSLETCALLSDPDYRTLASEDNHRRTSSQAPPSPHPFPPARRRPLPLADDASSVACKCGTLYRDGSTSDGGAARCVACGPASGPGAVVTGTGAGSDRGPVSHNGGGGGGTTSVTSGDEGDLDAAGASGVATVARHPSTGCSASSLSHLDAASALSPDRRPRVHSPAGAGSTMASLTSDIPSDMADSFDGGISSSSLGDLDGDADFEDATSDSTDSDV
ncbi:hypothetical protein H696_00451 [Fonticula alba]|uniref:RGS domain-containing protein n=1 Tax=Fonticula alba TaxID=691883 RepID=A0A058ZEP4_FONAL|nr:hypothetical protein H696_00451 [Fonticula alba]KCV72880.1 hypothetical protein H696_00451 [Fonticula alba]|eukprot:XP_009492581.1 hypothetical protein H696_00451 [Fonticula alba]